MVKMMHIAELKDIKETNMMKETKWKLEEQNKNINTMNNGVMENGRRDKERKHLSESFLSLDLLVS